ncbi:MAG: hypothetical protein KF784_08385 [Fimbriimonadaceae bacterium]|nr:hypothetical protein [Fimbriimonadaceae bacterium]
MKGIFVPIVAVTAIGAAGMGVSGLKDTVQPPAPPSGLDAHETHGSTSLLGQFRTSASSYLWLRADLYLHNGVEMRVLTEAELKAGHKGVGTADQIMGDEETHVTTIPTKDRDFRGIFGDVERSVSAFTDMKAHHHNNPEQSLPLFRLMTWLDPQFVTGWQVGASIIARERSDSATAKALAFLEEGIRNNPKSLTLHVELARLKITRQQELDDAIVFLSKAVRLGFALGDKLTEADQDTLEDAFRWLALCYRNTGQFKLMRATAVTGLKIFPEDQVLTGLLKVAPSILTTEGADQWSKSLISATESEDLFKCKVLDNHDDHDHDHKHGHDHEHGHGHDHGSHGHDHH